jgi:acetyl-CoA C-acetyltransferase
MTEDNRPIIVGVGQHTVRDGDTEGALEPVDMMALVARKAEEDAETKGLLQQLDSVCVVNIFAWRYRDPAGLLSERIGAKPREQIYTTLGGNTPQLQVNEAAEAIAQGTVKSALIAGVETVNSVRRARQRGVELSWTPQGKGAKMSGDARMGSSELELKYGASAPIQVYPLFENALRAHKGRSLDGHRAYLSKLCGTMSATAAENPYAWFRDGKSGDEITAPTPQNRYVGFPYTKYMNAIMDVDQAAAVIVTSPAEARRLGIPESKWIYLNGCADASDIWFISERTDFYSSPAIRRCGERALQAAGITIDDVSYFDLYSCFPVAVQIGRDMLGVPEDDPRPFTMTGGLPYFGGPGSNYSMHAIATMTERLRAEPDRTGVVTALGWYLTKHAIGVYSATPSESPWGRPDMTPDQQAIDSEPAPKLVERADGPATIETYTVMFDREGKPEYGIIVGRASDGTRFLAAPEPSALEEMTRREMVAVTGSSSYDEATSKNVFTF